MEGALTTGVLSITQLFLFQHAADISTQYAKKKNETFRSAHWLERGTLLLIMDLQSLMLC